MVAKLVDKDEFIGENGAYKASVEKRGFKYLGEQTSHNSVYVNSVAVPGFGSADEILMCP